MRTFTPEFTQANMEDRDPLVVVKIETPSKNIWLTSAQITLPVVLGDVVLQEVIVSATGTSQRITPERGFSTIGNQNIQFSDVGFTDELRALLSANQTIYNAKTITYWGFDTIAFEHFAYAPPMYVVDVSNDELSYTITLNDVQRFTKKSAFGDRPKVKVTQGIGTGGGTLGVITTNGFDLVAHGADWFGNAPSQNAGYLKVRGAINGEDVIEYIRYNSKTATTFNIVERGVFGTRTIDLQSSTSSVSIEVEEVIYLALPAPKMILALLTNDLYGQVGATIPDHWGAVIDATLVDVASFENIGDDIWGIDLEFIDLEETDIKRFIAEQCLSVLNLYFRIDQEGELSLSRFGSLDSQSPSGTLISYENMLAAPTINRNARHIRNNFLIKWEYRPEQELYARNQLYIDGDSIGRNNYTSPAYTLELRGIRNISRYSGLTVNLLAQSIRARFSDPSITFSAPVLMRDAAVVEVGDVVTVAMQNQPFENTDEYFQGAMEVQGASWDFLNGTCTLELFTNTGRATGLVLEEGNDVIESIDHTGWTELTTGSLGTVAGSDFLVANGANFAGGKYWFDGDLVFDALATPGFECFINESVVFDCRDFEMRGSAKINGVARGVTGARGGYGADDVGDDAFQQRRETKAFFFSDVWYQQLSRAGDNLRIPMTDPKLQSIKPRVDRSNKLLGIPEKLYGNGSSRGGRLVRETTKNNLSTSLGGAPAKGGAGLLVVCESFIYDSLSYDPVIDTSGGSGNFGAQTSIPGAGTFHAGRSGFGYPGLLMAFMKNSNSVAPILKDIHVARVGTSPERPWQVTYPIGKRHYRTQGSRQYGPYENNFSLRLLFNGLDVAKTQPVNFVAYVKKDADVAPIQGVDTAQSAKAPTLTLTESINTPRTPLGDQSTITVNAAAASGDAGFFYALFEYRLQGQQQWVPIAYDIRTEATFTVTSSGDTYEVRATSFNNAGQRGGVTIGSVTVSNVTRETDTSDGGTTNPPNDITVPPIKRLELVNRITNDDWDKFKSPNAEFRWAKLSTTQGGSITQLNGALDLHLEGYRVRISKDGKILREEIVKDSFYTYTYDKNKKDNKGSPVRSFRIDLMAVTTTGYVSASNGFEVENPAPAAPDGIVINTGFTTLEVVFNLPFDTDFVGVDVFLIEGNGDPYAVEPIRVSGNTFAIDGRIPNTAYTIGLRSVDQFGTGGQTTPVGFSTRLIESSALGAINTPVVIDEQGGRLITNNSGYIAFHGAVDAPSESPSPLIFGTVDGNSYPFWVDASGNGKFGRLALGADGSITSNNFSIAANGDATFSGELSAATGTITNVNATNLNVSGTSTLTGVTVNGASTFSGSLNGATGSFNGDVVAGSFATGSTGERIEINVSSSNSIIFRDDIGLVVARLDADVMFKEIPRATATFRANSLIGSSGVRFISAERVSTGIYQVVTTGGFVSPFPALFKAFQVQCTVDNGESVPAFASYTGADFVVIGSRARLTIKVKTISGLTLVDPELLTIRVYQT